MENSELYQQVLAAMKEQTEILTGMIKESETKLTGMIQESETKLTGMIKESETRLAVKMENDIEKRIDTLFDGYKLNHEKQWELEHKITDLEKRLERLEIQAG